MSIKYIPVSSEAQPVEAIPAEDFQNILADFLYDTYGILARKGVDTLVRFTDEAIEKSGFLAEYSEDLETVFYFLADLWAINEEDHENNPDGTLRHSPILPNEGIDPDDILKSTRVFLTDEGQALTLYDLYEEYEENRLDFYYDCNEVNFWEHVQNCTSKNGTLTEAYFEVTELEVNGTRYKFKKYLRCGDYTAEERRLYNEDGFIDYDWFDIPIKNQTLADCMHAIESRSGQHITRKDGKPFTKYIVSKYYI